MSTVVTSGQKYVDGRNTLVDFPAGTNVEAEGNLT